MAMALLQVTLEDEHKGKEVSVGAEQQQVNKVCMREDFLGIPRRTHPQSYCSFCVFLGVLACAIGPSAFCAHSIIFFYLGSKSMSLSGAL